EGGSPIFNPRVRRGGHSSKDSPFWQLLTSARTHSPARCSDTRPSRELLLVAVPAPETVAVAVRRGAPPHKPHTRPFPFSPCHHPPPSLPLPLATILKASPLQLPTIYLPCTHTPSPTRATEKKAITDHGVQRPQALHQPSHGCPQARCETHQCQ